MKFILSGANVFYENKFQKLDLFISDGIIVDFFPLAPNLNIPVFNFNHCFIFPGFTDVHVHLREPGFSYKETIQTGTMAAAAGGYTSVCSMPNLNPVPDCLETLKSQLDLIHKKANVAVYPYGSITAGERGEKLSDMEQMSAYVIGFSDDGRGVQNEEMMRQAMYKAKSLDKIIAAHCEDNRLLKGGYIHDGVYAASHGHKGICSESEWRPIERDLQLVRETGCKYHVCHVSAKESVALIRKARQEGLDVSCETAPHYLVLNDTMLEEDGRFKMNPPIRSEEDRLALVEGIQDGTISMIATDHAPHAAQEKAKGLAGSLMGVTGLETAFPVLYTSLVKSGVISLEKLITLLHTNPNERFGLPRGIQLGEKANLTIFDLQEEYVIDSKLFESMGKSTPFNGRKVQGKCKMTIADGRIIWKDKSIEK